MYVYYIHQNNNDMQTRTITSIRVKPVVRPLHEIANEINGDWKQVNFGAKPYLSAMFGLDKITDSYGADSAEMIVNYFLSNAGQWKGEVARRIKAELNKMVK